MSAPPLSRLLAELRAVTEYAAYVGSRSELADLPRGDGHRVIVYPGLLARDWLTAPLRTRLAALGYDAQGWGRGLNSGLKPGLLDAMLADLADKPGKVSLIGWSLGGLYARELAKRMPERVRRVITLGTPFAGDMRANNAWRLYELVNDHKVDAPPIDGDVAEPPPVPTVSIYSEDEGIIPVAASQNPDLPHLENVAVRGSHVGLPWSPAVIRIIADRLARP
jgi:Alpha/beta hydrolase family